MRVPPLELVERVAHPQRPQHQQQAEDGPLPGALDERVREGQAGCHLALVSPEQVAEWREVLHATVGQRRRVIVLVKD